jgi:hypothetical protein
MLSGKNATCSMRYLVIRKAVGRSNAAAVPLLGCREIVRTRRSRRLLSHKISNSNEYDKKISNSTAVASASIKWNWNIVTVLAVIISGTFFDRFGIDDTDSYTDSYTDISIPQHYYGGGRGRGRMMTTELAPPQRRETSFQIRLGNSVVVDHTELSVSASTTIAHNDDVILVLPEDKEKISLFLYELMNHIQLVHLKESDDGYNNKLPLGLPGLCCKHCALKKRKKSRSSTHQIFPMYQRTLPAQVRKKLYNHLRRCEHVQPEIKMELKRLKNIENNNIINNETTTTKVSREERQYFKRLWLRMGHKIEL